MNARRLIILGILFATSLSLFLTAPLYATPDREDDCLSCHNHSPSAITINSNVTGIMNVNSSTTFEVQITAVTAEANKQNLVIKWPSSLNPSSFTFLPSMVADNGPNDLDPADNKVNATFQIYTPVNPGDYEIQVFAADGAFNGANITFQTHIIKATGPITPGAQNVLPTAYFLYNRLGMTVKFADRSWDSDGNITSWLWNFGDNTNSTEQNPSHTFGTAGTYTVTLVVKDNKGGISMQSFTFAVPSANERVTFWGVQVFISSLMIVFTAVFAVGIAGARSRRGGK